MCYFCHDLKNNQMAPSHKSRNCRDKRNNYYDICNQKTQHNVQQNNGYEKRWPRCMKHT